MYIYTWVAAQIGIKLKESWTSLPRGYGDSGSKKKKMKCSITTEFSLFRFCDRKGSWHVLHRAANNIQAKLIEVGFFCLLCQTQCCYFCCRGRRIVFESESFNLLQATWDFSLISTAGSEAIIKSLLSSGRKHLNIVSFRDRICVFGFPLVHGANNHVMEGYGLAVAVGSLGKASSPSPLAAVFKLSERNKASSKRIEELSKSYRVHVLCPQ